MDYSGVTFGLDVLVSVIFGAGGALGVWFKVKGKQDLMALEMENHKSNSQNERNAIKKDVLDLEKTNRDLVKKVDSHKTENDGALMSIEKLILQTKIDIIQEIHAKK